MYLIAFPLLLIPFVLYNMIIFLLNMPFSEVVFSIPLLEERRLPVTTADLLVMLGMLLLYVEVLKAARLGSKGFMDHVLSFALFVGMAAELALVPRAMTTTLLLLSALAFVDVIIGLSFIGRRKQREIVLEDDDQAHERSQQGR
jgi:undecaprenyl pyrophosphate phosphatase UppP